MPDLDRMVAGLRCREVLELLSDYVDGELSPETVARVRAHLAECDHCERFGGTFGALVARLREGAVADEDLDAGARRRLADRMSAEWADGPAGRDR